MKNPRQRALEHAVRQYEKSLESLTAINEELRTLPPSARLNDILELNQMALRTTTRMLAGARERLANQSRSCPTELAGHHLSGQPA